MSNGYDVIVVGAGPVGLSLALALGKDHHQVLVLEKDPDVHEHSRAPAIWPRTQEILADLGVIDRFLAEGIIHKEPTLWDGDQNPPKPLIRFPLEEISDVTSYTQLLILPQSKTERFLLDEIQSNYPHVKVMFNAELTSLTQTDKNVTVSFDHQGEKESLTASFVVGCDGAHSKVRELLGFHLEGQTYPLDAALADVRISPEEGSHRGSGHSPRFSTKDFLCLAIQIEKDVWRLILPYEKQDPLPLEERIQKSVKALFHQEEFDLIWKSQFHLHRRISTGFQKGRVVLAGDAAHLNSPAGGQGMNSGIQDIEKLRIFLNEALAQNSSLPLENYVRKRKKAVGEVNQFTNALTQGILFGTGGLIKIIMKALNLVLKIKPLRRRFLLKIAMFD